MFGYEKVRYAVVGAGWFGQVAVLPAFANTNQSALAAIFSGDDTKREELSQEYGVPAYGYDQYDEILAGDSIDAVYIVLPNSMHKDFTIRAARRGKHVLCEKPLAPTPADCEEMIAACEQAGVKLMTAYRLHHEEGNLAAVESIRSGAIGQPRVFQGLNTQQITDADNIRLDADLAGGPLLDLGVYCINAARYLFQADPVAVVGFSANSTDPRFREVPDMVTALLRFPDEKVAVFTCGFDHGKVSDFRVVGTTGDIRMDPAYSFTGDLYSYLTVDGKTTKTRYREGNQVGAEIDYFSERINHQEDPEP